MNRKIIDLTQTIKKGIPDRNGCCGFQMEQIMDYPDGARVQELTTPSGIGTHMDAPSHFINGGNNIADIEIEQFISPGVAIDISSKADPYYALSVDDITQFEKQHGAIPEKSIVIVYTGWGIRWDDPVQYRNEDAQGIMRFPRISVEAAEFLLKRNINGVAIDTLSPDWPDSDFPVHQKLLGAGKFIIENIKFVNSVPAFGFTIIALPIKIELATEAMCRIVAMIEQ